MANHSDTSAEELATRTFMWTMLYVIVSIAAFVLVPLLS